MNASTPFLVVYYLFISSAYDFGCALVDVSGDVPHAVWENRAMRNKMAGLKQSGSIGLGDVIVPYREGFAAERVDEASVADCIRWVKAGSGYLLDPHSACAVVAARKTMTSQTQHIPHIALATAHPAKFPDAMQAITGERPPLPPRLDALLSAPERVSVLPNDLGAVERFVEDRAGRRRGAAA